MRIARSHDALHGEQARVSVVGVEPVPLPWVMSEHDRGLELPDPVRHLPPLAQAGLELAVHPVEEHALAGGAEGAGGARCSAWRVTTSAAASVDRSQLPLAPSVQMRWWTIAPAADHLASVAPHPNSTSSGWAPMASATAGVGRFRDTGRHRQVGRRIGSAGTFRSAGRSTSHPRAASGTSRVTRPSGRPRRGARKLLAP